MYVHFTVHSSVHSVQDCLKHSIFILLAQIIKQSSNDFQSVIQQSSSSPLMLLLMLINISVGMKFDQIPNMFEFSKYITYWILNIFGSWKMTRPGIVVWISFFLLSHPSLVAQWHLQAKRKVLGSIPRLGKPFLPKYDCSLHQELSLKRLWMIGKENTGTPLLGWSTRLL